VLTCADPLLFLWGKAQPGNASDVPFHPLIYHCLDVAAVGETLLVMRPDWLERLSWDLDISAGPACRLFLFLLALHDIGKLSRPFQAKAPAHWPGELLGPLSTELAGPRHDAAGLALLGDHIRNALDPVLVQWNDKRRTELLAPFLGHHGKPVEAANIDVLRVFGSECLHMARAFVTTMHGIFAPEAIAPIPKGALMRASWRLAGLAVLADWIGSTQRWFPYEAPELAANMYMERCARPRAAAALIAAGLAPARPSLVSGFAIVSSSLHAPSAVQHWAETVALPDGPCLALIEEVTGGGKTEAALVLAHRLMAAGRAKGLFIALPTMATANAMFDRLASACQHLFAAGEAPSRILAHGRRDLHRGFRDLKLKLGDPSRIGGLADERDESGVEATNWLLDDRRKVFFADVGVGTIDQALLGVLPAKHQSLRLLGLADRVLIVDEAHAYDAYMTEGLKRLLMFQAALGGNAVVLSATLPCRIRGELASAFALGLGQAAPTMTATDYPLVTMVSGTGATEDAKQHRPDLGRRLRIERLALLDEAIRRIAEADAAGAAVAWVRNSVDDAIDAVERLNAEGVQAELFHARFAMGDRLDIERRVVARFGKEGDPIGRAGVLVATQVVESSLDLDFDLMVSDLAPVDLLLQRAGRIWRHSGRHRPIDGPTLLVLSPDPDVMIEKDWFAALLPRAAWVYRNHALLWLSAREIFVKTEIAVPEDVRGIIEAVYGEGKEAGAPTALERYWIEASGSDQAARSMAGMNLLRVEKGYGGEHAGWASDVDTPTRLGEPMVTLRLARIEGDAIVPFYADPDPTRAWSLSEVMVRASRVKGVPELPKLLLPASQAAVRSWGRYADRFLLVPIRETEEPMSWASALISPRDALLSFRYDRLYGLRWK
jgi:CRISPR-associated endonuclease/helicase Cas3